jgi:hypothetical protein
LIRPRGCPASTGRKEDKRARACPAGHEWNCHERNTENKRAARAWRISPRLDAKAAHARPSPDTPNNTPNAGADLLREADEQRLQFLFPASVSSACINEARRSIGEQIKRVQPTTTVTEYSRRGQEKHQRADRASLRKHLAGESHRHSGHVSGSGRPGEASARGGPRRLARPSSPQADASPRWGMHPPGEGRGAWRALAPPRQTPPPARGRLPPGEGRGAWRAPAPPRQTPPPAGGGIRPGRAEALGAP